MPKTLKPYYAKHGVTLYRADCRQVMATLADASIDFVFTDPPYGADQNSGDLNASLGKREGKTRRAIANDGLAAADELVRDLFAAGHRLLRPGSCFACCCHGGGGKSQQHAKWSMWLDAIFDWENLVVWDKGPMGLGWHYRRSYELVIVGKKRGARCAWYDTSHRIENIIRPGQYGIRKVPGRQRSHPTQKPPALAAHFIRLHTQPGELVLDPCAGSGSTLAAAVMTGRKAIGCELEKDYCDAAIAAIEQAVASRESDRRP